MTRADDGRRKNIKNAILSALTEEFQTPSTLYEKAGLKGRTSLSQAGHLLKALVAERMVDVQIQWGSCVYRKGTGLTIRVPNKTRGRGGAALKEIRQSEMNHSLIPENPIPTSAPTPSTKTPTTPSVIPAGSDFLVFSNIVKIRKESDEYVRVFYAVPGDDYNLVMDVYEGKAAKDILAAFDQRLNGWISLDIVKELRAKITYLEIERAKLQNLLAQANNRLDAIRKASG